MKKGYSAALLASAATAAALGSAHRAAADTASTHPSATAATAIGEILVTARRREENLEKVPVAVTAITATQIRQLQITTGRDLEYDTPSLNISGVHGHDSAYYSIRGLGQGTFGQATVSTYFSETPFPTPGSGGDAAAGAAFYDVSSVQVLKGPQGTLFGRTTTAGAVLITPNHPDLNDWSGSADVAEGNLGLNQDTLVLNAPIVPGQLALRLAVNRNYRDGYTQVIGSNIRLDGENTDSLRLSLEWKPGRFDNYAVVDLFHQDETPVADELAGYNPNYAFFNLPAPNTPLGLIYGGAIFGSACAQAITYGFSTDLTTCEQQRLALVDAYKPALAAEIARQAAGGSAALRSIPTDTGIPLVQKGDHFSFIDIAQYDLGDLGFSKVSLKNIFGYQTYDGLTAEDDGGIPNGLLVAAGFGPTATGQQAGNQPVQNLGPVNKFYTDEFQVNGVVGDNRLVWVLGYYYQDAPVTVNAAGVSNLYQIFSGTLTPNLGYSSAEPFFVGGSTQEQAGYGQFTLDLSHLLLNGLHFTAGARYTQDRATSTTAAAVFNYPAGNITPGAQGTSSTSSSGVGWTLALDYQVTDGLLLYVTGRSGYQPGGLNSVTGAASLPAFTPTYSPETVQDVEIGAKDRFQLGGAQGVLNVDLYRAWYSNIQESFTGVTAGGNDVAYTENAAAAILQGVEVEATLLPVERLTLTAQYSYNDSYYTRWMSEDPLNVAPAGTIIDLSNNPFANAPAQKLSFTARYQIPIAENAGDLFAALTVYGQSRTWFTTTATRLQQLMGAGVAQEISQPAYALLNARVDWENVFGKGFSVSLFGKNLTDKVYATAGDVALTSVGIADKEYAEPRTFGIELRYRFGP